MAGDDNQYLRGGNPIYDASAWNPGLGVPGGQLEDAGGSVGGNYRRDVPIVQLPGRGLDLDLKLHYNSQLWSREESSDGELTFDADRDWPAPGWSLGFGKLLFPGLLVDADNTRHTLTFTGGAISKARLSPDSTITVECHNCGKAGAEGEAIVTYPDGRTVKYNSLGAGPHEQVLYPTAIVDVNGNYISIEYKQEVVGNTIPAVWKTSAPKIARITDTVGRIIRFDYDTAMRLVSISGPGPSGAYPTMAYARFFYSSQTVDVSLKLNNGHVVPHYKINYAALSTIYFPGNGSAFVLTDYQRHGMPREIQERRGVQAAPYGGQILSLGSLSRSIRFALTSPSPFSEPPVYRSQTERWSDPAAGQDRTAVTTFDLARVNNSRIITVTYPDGTSTVQTASEAPGRIDRGLVSVIQRKSSEGRLLSTTTIQWELGTHGVPRQKEVSFLNHEISRQTKTAFRYGQNNQQIVEEIHYAYGTAAIDGPALWKKLTEYLDDAGYSQRNILNLPKSVTYFDGDRVAPSIRTDYEYDGAPITPIPNVTNHLIASDPIRGKMTSIRRYANATEASGSITTHFRYDSAGNLIAKFDHGLSAIEYLYDASTKFSMPTRISRGTTHDQISSTFHYDLNVGLLRSHTNTDGRTATYEYARGAAGWRLSKLIRANGSSYSRTYLDDSLSHKTSVAKTAGGPATDILADFDGRGSLRKTSWIRLLGPSHVQAVEYDDMGRIHRLSRPYPDGTTASWITNTYDDAGRLAKVSGADGSDRKFFYNESTAPDSVVRGEPAETLRVEDPWGRTRWINYDEQHNIRGVVEPNPSGAGNVFEPGSLLTRYYFDPFGRLRTITQGKQVRFFIHDSLGRLISQGLPERGQTLDVEGNYVGRGAFSDVFAYDARSNLVSKTDARGVKTLYEYDGTFDRLQSVRYVIDEMASGSSQIMPAPDVNYEYQIGGDKRRLKRIVTSGVANEAFECDLDGRLIRTTMTLDAYPTRPFVIGYDYDELDRVREVRYPARYSGAAKAPRPSLRYIYSDEGPLQRVELDRTVLADDARYNADGNLASLRLETVDGSLSESYDFDPRTGILIGQKLTKNSQELLRLAYELRRMEGVGGAGVTGQITGISDVLEPAKSQLFQYDALGRLTSARLGELDGFLNRGRQAFSWQEYRYDRYGNRTSVKAFSPGSLVRGSPAVELDQQYRDGLGELIFDEKTNHIRSIAFAYDEAGNLTGIKRGDGFGQKYVYDAADRLVRVTGVDDSLIEAYVYGWDKRPLAMSPDLSAWTYWVWSGDTRLAQYKRAYNASYTAAPIWSQNNFSIGERLLLTAVPPVTRPARRFHHPGRLGTIAISAETGSSSQTFKQGTLPFGTDGTALQSWQDSRRFTSYERAAVSGLDQAVNRYYDSRLGRFTQVDPLEIGASDLSNPQSLNMYTYVANDPVNAVDPSGLRPIENPCKGKPDGTTIGDAVCIGGVATFIGSETVVIGTLPSAEGALGGDVLLPGRGSEKRGAGGGGRGGVRPNAPVKGTAPRPPNFDRCAPTAEDWARLGGYGVSVFKSAAAISIGMYEVIYGNPKDIVKGGLAFTWGLDQYLKDWNTIYADIEKHGPVCH